MLCHLKEKNFQPKKNLIYSFLTALPLVQEHGVNTN